MYVRTRRMYYPIEAVAHEQSQLSLCEPCLKRVKMKLKECGGEGEGEGGGGYN